MSVYSDLKQAVLVADDDPDIQSLAVLDITCGLATLDELKRALP